MSSHRKRLLPLAEIGGASQTPFVRPPQLSFFTRRRYATSQGKELSLIYTAKKPPPPARKRWRGRAGGSPCPKTLPLCPFPFLLRSPPCPLHGQPLRGQGAPGTAAAPGGGQGEGIGPGPTPVPAPGVVGRDPSPPRPPPGCPGLPLKLEGTLRVPARHGGGGAAPRSPWGMYRRVSDPGKEPGPWGATCVPLGSRLYSPRKLSAKIWGKTCLC